MTGAIAVRWIIEPASRLPAISFVLDGEGVILRQDGVADLDRLHSSRHDGAVQLLGFDLLELDGDDCTKHNTTDIFIGAMNLFGPSV